MVRLAGSEPPTPRPGIRPRTSYRVAPHVCNRTSLRVHVRNGERNAADSIARRASQPHVDSWIQAVRSRARPLSPAPSVAQLSPALPPGPVYSEKAGRRALPVLCATVSSSPRIGAQRHGGESNRLSLTRGPALDGLADGSRVRGSTGGPDPSPVTIRRAGAHCMLTAAHGARAGPTIAHHRLDRPGGQRHATPAKPLPAVLRRAPRPARPWRRGGAAFTSSCTHGPTSRKNSVGHSRSGLLASGNSSFLTLDAITLARDHIEPA
jgi:hypothetical protein